MSDVRDSFTTHEVCEGILTEITVITLPWQRHARLADIPTEVEQDPLLAIHRSDHFRKKWLFSF